MTALPARARCADMLGTFQKTTEAHALACQTCAAFRDDDPDIYYCELQQEEFPALCEQYRQSERIAPLRTQWEVPDELCRHGHRQLLVMWGSRSGSCGLARRDSADSDV